MSDSSKNTGKSADIFRVSSLLTATAIWSFANGAAAQEVAVTATDAPEGAEQIDEVVVTGFRASLNKALEDKRRQQAPIDSIRAEDIVEIPRFKPRRIRCSASPACPSPATRAKDAISACADWVRSSRACASTAWKR